MSGSIAKRRPKASSACSRASSGLRAIAVERAEAFGHVVGVGELAVGELQSLDHVAVDEQAEGDVAERAAAGGGGVGAERRGIGELGVQGGERAGMRAPERAAHGLARDVDRVRIDVVADLARDVGFRRQAHRQGGEGVIDAAGAGVLDQRAEGGRQRPVTLGRAAGANGAHAADEDRASPGSGAIASG